MQANLVVATADFSPSVAIVSNAGGGGRWRTSVAVMVGGVGAATETMVYWSQQACDIYFILAMLNRQYKTMYDTNEIGEEMRRHIDRLIDEFEFILQQQKEMCSKAIKIYDHTQRKLKKAE